MRQLHIITRAEDPLAMEIIAAQRVTAAGEVELLQLGDPATTDYTELLEKIFAAEAVAVW